MNAPIDPNSVSAPPTREEIFELISPIFSAVNSHDLAIHHLMGDDLKAALAALKDGSQALDEALAAIKLFLGVTE